MFLLLLYILYTVGWSSGGLNLFDLEDIFLESKTQTNNQTKVNWRQNWDGCKLVLSQLLHLTHPIVEKSS